MPPEIISSSLDEGDTLVLDFRQTYVFVVVEDPNGDDFTCNWFVQGEEPFGPGEPLLGSGGDTGAAALEGCGLWLYPDTDFSNFAAYDGKELTCEVYDLPARDIAKRSWPIDFLGEGT